MNHKCEEASKEGSPTIPHPEITSVNTNPRVFYTHMSTPINTLPTKLGP